MNLTNRGRWLVVPAILVFTMACKSGGNPGSGNPAPNPSPNPGPGTTTTTITISNNAVSPKDIVVARGARVTFVNSDGRPHEMNSDPHPEHTGANACTEINQVGFLNPNQSKETGNLNTARVCRYHDHNQDTNEALKGTITVQ